MGGNQPTNVMLTIILCFILINLILILRLILVIHIEYNGVLIGKI